MDDELIHQVSRFFKRNKLKRRLNQLQQDLKQTEKLVGELTQKAQEQLEDVEILKKKGLASSFYRLKGTLEDKISAEEKEMRNAFSKLKQAKESLLVIQDEIESTTRNLSDFVDIDSTLELLAIKVHNMNFNSDSILQIAHTTSQTHLLIREIEEKIAFGDQAKNDLTVVRNNLSHLVENVGIGTQSRDSKNIANSLDILETVKDHLHYFDEPLSFETSKIISDLYIYKVPMKFLNSYFEKAKLGVQKIENIQQSIDSIVAKLSQVLIDKNMELLLLEQRWNAEGKF